MKKVEVRKTVQALKKFYVETLHFILGSLLFTFIWFVFDRSGAFWPKYIVLVWGITLLVSAYRKGIMSYFVDRISFLTHEWEEEKVSEIIGHQENQKKIHLHRYWKK